MLHKILFFGQTREIVGVASIELGASFATLAELTAELFHRYPLLAEVGALRFAVNQQYAEADIRLHGNEEIALIPPVSGG